MAGDQPVEQAVFGRFERLGLAVDLPAGVDLDECTGEGATVAGVDPAGEVGGPLDVARESEGEHRIQRFECHRGHGADDRSPAPTGERVGYRQHRDPDEEHTGQRSDVAVPGVSELVADTGHRLVLCQHLEGGRRREHVTVARPAEDEHVRYVGLPAVHRHVVDADLVGQLVCPPLDRRTGVFDALDRRMGVEPVARAERTEHTGDGGDDEQYTHPGAHTAHRARFGPGPVSRFPRDRLGVFSRPAESHRDGGRARHGRVLSPAVQNLGQAGG